MTVTIFILIFCSIACGTATQIFFKNGVRHLKLHGNNIRQYFNFGLNALATPLIWCGLVASVIAITLWLTVLAQLPLSVAYSFDSLQYVLILVASSIFLREKIGLMRILGTGLIIVGIVLAALSQ